MLIIIFYSLTTPRGDVTKRYIPLDYPRLKHDLLLLPNESKVLILQALRWVSELVEYKMSHGLFLSWL